MAFGSPLAMALSCLYGTQLGIDSTHLVMALLVTQFVAFPSAIAYDEDRKIMYQRALTGELENSIAALSWQHRDIHLMSGVPNRQ